MKNGEKGFTLLELMAVIVILAVLSTIAIPVFSGKAEEAKVAADEMNKRILYDQASLYVVDQISTVSGDITQKLVEKGYINELPNNPFSEKDYEVIVDENGNIKIEAPVEGEFGYELVRHKILGDNDTQEVTLKVIQDNDGNYIIAGGKTVSGNRFDFYIVKLNSNLDIMKENLSGGAMYDSYSSVIQSSNGNYICVGVSESDLTSIGGKTNPLSSGKFVIAEYDNDLNLLKINDFAGNTNFKNSMYNDILENRDGDYICIGNSSDDLTSLNGGNINKGNSDFVISKHSKNLTLVSMKTTGGSDMDGYTRILQSKDGSYICGGYSESDLSGIGSVANGFSTDMPICASYDNELNMKKIKYYVSEDFEYSLVSQITELTDGSYICLNTNDGMGMTAMKLDGEIELTAMEKYYGNTEYSNIPTCVVMDASDNIIACGAKVDYEMGEIVGLSLVSMGSDFAISEKDVIPFVANPAQGPPGSTAGYTSVVMDSNDEIVVIGMFGTNTIIAKYK